MTHAPPAMPRNERILASAGSGKTYTLTSRYLQLVAAGAPPEGLLATTFTRAAAGEIRNRIIMRLVQAAGDDAHRAQLAEAMNDPTLTKADFLQLLRTMTQHLHRLQIRTLDSFFAAVVQSFALELGLPAGCAIVEEAEATAIRDEAIRLMLDEARPQELIDILRQLSTVDASRRVHERLDQQLRELYELCRHIDDDAWVNIPQVGRRLSDAQLFETLALFREHCPNNDHKGWVKGHSNDVANALAQDWKMFVENGIANKIVMGEASYCKRAIDKDCLALYRPLIDHALAVLIEDKRQQNDATRRLMQLFMGHYEQLKIRNRTLTFSDLAPSLVQTHQCCGLDELYFRLDSTIDHLLLDEFQDTSIEQWLGLRPIAQELILGEADGRSFFCVGDVKQSIYGWRSAEPEILEQLPTLILDSGDAVPETALGAQTLARSYRSAPPVIDAVNDVFSTIDRNQALREFPEVAADFKAAFEEHDTNLKQLPGYAELRVMPRGGSADERNQRRLAEAAQRAADLHKAAPGMSIGILTRTNKALGRLLYELGPSGLNVPAGGRGRGSLTDAPAVEAVLDLIQLADHPDDTIAAYHVANAPVAELFDAPPNLAEKQGTRERHRIARRLRQQLADHGYASTLSRWLPTLAPHCDQRELQRLLQLIELAETFDAGPGFRADAFIKLVETQEVPDVRPAPIQVMTIHKAKGLEFDAVILPDLSNNLKGKAPAVVYDRDSITGPVTRICRYMNETLRAAVPELEPMFTRHYERAVREGLSLLYVALTRARHALYMYVEPASKSGGYRQAADGVLLHALADDSVVDAVAYQRGDPKWIDALPASMRKTEPAVEAPTVGAIMVPPARQRVGAAAAPSAHADDDSGGLHFDIRDRGVDDRGRAIHALFEQIEWLDDGLPDRAAMKRIVRRAARHQPASWIDQQIDAFEQMTRQPTVQQRLTRPADREGVSLTVHTELPFVRDVEDGAQQGSIDRIVVQTACNGVTAQIIDFKTDTLNATSAEQRAEHYRRQLDAYRAAAAELLQLDPANIECVVLFVAADEAVVL